MGLLEAEAFLAVYPVDVVLGCGGRWRWRVGGVEAGLGWVVCVGGPPSDVCCLCVQVLSAPPSSRWCR